MITTTKGKPKIKQVKLNFVYGEPNNRIHQDYFKQNEVKQDGKKN